MDRSVSTRNLIGGFFGGIVGILASWYMDPTALPFGVLLGVIVGWWNEDIVRLLGGAHQQANKIASGFVGATDYVVSAFARFCGLPSAIASVFRRILAKAIVGTIVALTSAPARFTRWLAPRHLMDRAYAIKFTMSLVFVVGSTPMAMLFLEPYVGIEKSGDRGVIAFLSFIVAVSGSFVYWFLHMPYEDSESCLYELGRFYREWEVISRYGSFGFLLYTAAMQIRYMIGIIVFCAVIVPWLTITVMVGFLGIYPLIAGIAVVHGFYKIASRFGHWLCLGVTMAVTGISWLVYHESFADPRILWMVALGTGIVSGGATELVRRFVLVFYGSTTIGRRLAADSVWKLVMSDEEDDKCYVGVMSKFGGMWFEDNRLARMFRAICFNTPEAQPVRI